MVHVYRNVQTINILIRLIRFVSVNLLLADWMGFANCVQITTMLKNSRNNAYLVVKDQFLWMENVSAKVIIVSIFMENVWLAAHCQILLFIKVDAQLVQVKKYIMAHYVYAQLAQYLEV